MSSSRHPRALAIERQVGRGARLLGTVMGLPLVDGIFPALVLAGALSTWTGMLEIGLLVFGGSATVAIILAEMDDSPRQQALTVLLIGAVLIPMAVVEAALAPTIAGLIDLSIFEPFAGIVILAVAAQTASARVAEYLPRPAVIIGLGLVASFDPAGASLVVDLDPEMMARAAGTAGVGVGFALAVALGSPWLRNAVDIDRFRFGSAVALGVLALSVFGVLPTTAPVSLAVLVVTAVLALDPENARERHSDYHPDDIDLTAAFADGGATQGVAADEHTDDGNTVDYDPDQERAPWL